MTAELLLAITYVFALAASLTLMVFYAIAYRSFQKQINSARPRLAWQTHLLFLLQSECEVLFWQGHRVGRALSGSCRHVDPGDPYRSIGELCRWLLEIDSVQDIHSLRSAIKGLYQLDLSLAKYDISLRIYDDIASLAQGAVGETIGAVEIDSFELVRPGEAVDRERMIPVSAGSRIIQPLGPVFTAKDTVVVKARVLCD